MGDRAETCFELRITYFGIMINYRLFQKFKLLGEGEFNHLTIILTLVLILSGKLMHSRPIGLKKYLC